MLWRMVDPSAHSAESFAHVLATRLDRRRLLAAGAATTGWMLLGSGPLAACSRPTQAAASGLLGFAPVKKHTADKVEVPDTYRFEVIYALGDPLTGATAEYRNDGSDEDHDRRAGDHHDGIEYFGLSADGTPSRTSNDRALLAMNHEATTYQEKNKRLRSHFLHQAAVADELPRLASEVDKEVAVHGISVVEVAKVDGAFRCRRESRWNRRITPLTPVAIHGPARGNPLLRTRYSPDGTMGRGTLNNCGTGRTPWGTLLSGEENWSFYFTRPVADDAARGFTKQTARPVAGLARSVVALRRYGRAEGEASRHGWETAGDDDRFRRWNIACTAGDGDGTADYRHEMNSMGFLVELDPYDPTKTVRKRTALGRFAHEAAAFARVVAGQPIVIYQGDDARNEYIYKWVSAAKWSPADADAADRLAAGDKYLDAGTLYVARFGADGSGEWLPLTFDNKAVRSSPDYVFADAGDVCLHSRLAGDAVGATRMDRPEWCSVNPRNGEAYFTLTNNSNRRVEAAGSPQVAVDGPNPRSYEDEKVADDGKTKLLQSGNVNGHILRLAEAGGDPAATTFRWDIYLFGAEATADPTRVNLSGLTTDQDFSSPDGIAFSTVSGLCWIQTDDQAATDASNSMMLAALPGQVGDGGKVGVPHPRPGGEPLVVDTWVGKRPDANTLKRFLVGPRECEITGLCETPDGRTLFVNIQHPGELSPAASIGEPATYTSHWPGNHGYGAGGERARPRSATIVITRRDGGRIGT